MNFGGIFLDSDVLRIVQDWRRQIHQRPEMAFEEFKTSSLVATALASFGYEVTTGIAKTGVVAVKKFGKGPSIALRADMDALPIHEKNDLYYASQHDGCMHACGHDGHTAMLLGAAKLLAQHSKLEGTLILIFQPAEENEGGARAMIEDGLLKQFSIDAIFGLHNMPGVPVGTFQVRSGSILASFDRFDIQIDGVGGHGATPHQARDPVAAAAALTTGLNSIVSRDVSPTDSAIITVGHIESIGSYNVIPDRATLRGSCRSLSADTRKFLKSRVHEYCKSISYSHCVKISCDFDEGYPATINSAVESQFVEKTLSSAFGAGNICTSFAPYLGSEDFSFYLEKLPGCYFIIGNGPSSPLHSSSYDFNDEAAKYGVAAWVKIAEAALQKKIA